MRVEASVLTSNELLDVLFAAHYSYMVEGEHFPERGGIMILGPQETLKTTLIRTVAETGGALILGDVVNKSINAIKDQVASGRWRTIGFDDFAMLYRRKITTAKATLGVLMQLTEEGCTRLGAASADAPTGTPARCMVVSGMTISFAQMHWEHWKSGDFEGFLRRFLWCTVQLENKDLLIEAVIRWKRWNLTPHGSFYLPIGTLIPHVCRREEASIFLTWLQPQFAMGAGGQTPFKMLVRIFSVLVWVYEHRGYDGRAQAMAVMARFAQTFKPEGAVIRLEIDKEEPAAAPDPGLVSAADLEDLVVAQ